MIYIHNNPVHHGFCHSPVEYPWSSYMIFLSDHKNWMAKEDVLGLFDGIEDYIELHQLISGKNNFIDVMEDE